MKPPNQNLPDRTKPAHEPLPRDKQLQTVNLSEVLEKCRLNQALNKKEIAVRAGISYSASRDWFSLPGFPAFRGVVFYDDFINWRNSQPVAAGRSSDLLPRNGSIHSGQRLQPAIIGASNRANQLLDESNHGVAPHQAARRTPTAALQKKSGQ